MTNRIHKMKERPITKGISPSCCSNYGGIRKIYIADFDSLLSYTQDDAGLVNQITLAPGTKYHEFYQVFGRSNLVEEWTISIANHTTFYSQTLTFIIPMKDYDKRVVLDTLTNKKLSVIVKDVNDKYWLMGTEGGAWITSLMATQGQQLPDFNGYNVEIYVASNQQLPEVHSNIIPNITLKENEQEVQ